MPKQMVYYFGDGHADGSRHDKTLLGGKGANLAEMTRIGLPVPPGFTITTEVCLEFMRRGRTPDDLESQVLGAIERMEADTGRSFGGGDEPLLLAVRSGAAVSMPGMMDTILNLGLNDETVEAVAAGSGDPRFAFDSYRRFVQMYADVVLGVPHRDLDALIESEKESLGVEADTDLPVGSLKKLVAAFKRLASERTGHDFPEDPKAQLDGSIEAVLRSWMTDRAVAYRKVHRIPDDLGTAVNVMAMVFGNMGDDSGTGVAFTRDPSTGEKRLYGEFLLNAQGEDVVAGIRDPIPLDRMREHLPEPYEELVEVQHTLEHHYRDMQDLEFTVERGRLYILQTRRGKRAAAAALRIATDMVDEGLITEDEAVMRMDPVQLDQLLHPRVDPDADVVEIATGLPASPGAAVGRIVFDPDKAAERGTDDDPVILVRRETSPDDFHGMVAAEAILTARGGMTSHAAVVARGMGKPCVAGARNLRIDHAAGRLTTDGHTLSEGDWITVDGTDGRVLLGQVPTVEPEPGAELEQLMGWADRYRRLGVRTNADTPEDARRAREFGAEGIGLCRTEHMFFEDGRIQVVREMILAHDAAARERALDRLLPMQRGDFEAIFRTMDGLPVTIRLLDPPLHEFLPSGEHEIHRLATDLGMDEGELRRALDRHSETNPMLGHRGVRLGLTYPEITAMQARAIFEAAVRVAAEGVDVRPEVMIPLVGEVEELRRQRRLIDDVAEDVFRAAGREIAYLVGTMIELPRAALTAGKIALEADFFSFGTNDLTQTVFGLSRDDAGSFLPSYVEKGILRDDPFQVLDVEGVGRLIALASEEGRAARPDLKVGICGEHGGEPRSVDFFHRHGLDYVSCSPFRVPVARLSAARSALQEEERRDGAAVNRTGIDSTGQPGRDGMAAAAAAEVSTDS